MSVVHFLDRRTSSPLCDRPDTEKWSWTLAPSAVSCPECRRLLAEERPAAPHGG